MQTSTLVAVLAIAAAALTQAVQAQSYPAKPIRIIVGAAPGGGTDFIARIVGQRLSETWASRSSSRTVPVREHHRIRARRQVGARRLHAQHDHAELVRSIPASTRVKFDPAQRLHAGPAGRARSFRHRRAPVAACAHHARAPMALAKDDTGRDYLRQERPGRDRPPRDRAFLYSAGQNDPRALQKAAARRWSISWRGRSSYVFATPTGRDCRR